MAKSSEIESAEDVVQWFLTDKNGDLKEKPTHDEADLRMLVDSMLSLPDPFGWKDEKPSPATVWNRILEFGFLYLGGKFGWIDRDGKLWTCGHAKHDFLLTSMGMEVDDAERRGWVRVTMGPRYQARYRMSPRQRRKLKALGIEPDSQAERLLPIWVENDTGPISTANLSSDRQG